MPDWPSTTATFSEQLRAEQESNLLMQEAMADLELALEDRGWQALTHDAQHQFTREGLRRASALCRILAVSDPLTKRGLQLRIAHVWGAGLDIQARAAGDDANQDVNAVVQTFLDDNQASLTSGQAHEELERSLGSDGNVVFGLFTSPLTGRVRTRSFDPDEIEDIVTNPDDRDEPWFYLRQYGTTVVEAGYAGTRSRRETRREYHPALGFRPRSRPRSIDGIPVNWDAPVLHVAVNRLNTWSFGIGDAYASMSWTRAYSRFLTDWAGLIKALSRFAFRQTNSSKGRAAQAAARARSAVAAGPTGETPVGGIATMGPGQTLEAIPKSGATIDADSGRPLAAMVAAGLGVPVTQLLADPGVTGARATAETLDRPTRREMEMRQDLWVSTHRRILQYVIEQAVKAPAGPLRGTVGRNEYGDEVITLADDVEATVDISFPSLEDVDIDTRVKALAEADATGKVPPLTIARLLLQVLGVDDIDEVLAELTDDDGNFVDPDATAGQRAVDAFNRGDDPVDALA